MAGGVPDLEGLRALSRFVTEPITEPSLVLTKVPSSADLAAATGVLLCTDLGDVTTGVVWGDGFVSGVTALGVEISATGVTVLVEVGVAVLLPVGVADLATGVVDLAAGVDDLAAGVDDLAAGVDDLAAGVDDLATGVTDAATGVADAATGVELFTAAAGDVALTAGEVLLTPGVEAAAGVTLLAAGVTLLAAGVTLLAAGVTLLAAGVTLLAAGVFEAGDLEATLGLRDPPRDFGVTLDKLDMALLGLATNSTEQATIELLIIVFCKLLDYCNK